VGTSYSFFFKDLVIPIAGAEEDNTGAAAIAELAAEADTEAAAAEAVGAKPAIEDGLDNRWNNRMREQLERMKLSNKKVRDTSVTVTQKAGLTGALSSRQRRTSSNSNNNTTLSGSGRIREELSQPKGKIRFLTGQDDGTIEICIQSVLASIKTPVRFALRVSMAGEDEEEEEATKAQVVDELAHTEINSHLTRLDRELQTLQNRVKACLNNADFNKDQEAAFHNQSIAMNRAATYWPLIQLTVLFITGFTQANHIVRYLKSHHIGI
jgi:hypothetical protein